MTPSWFPKSFSLTEEVREALDGHQDFLFSLKHLGGLTGCPLEFRLADPESHSETRIDEEGRKEIRLVYPVDSNANPNDGRLYVEDIFSFDPEERKLQKFERRFNSNGTGGAQWKNYWVKLSEPPFQEILSPNFEDAEKFASQIVLRLPRPLCDQSFKMPDNLKKVFDAYGEYWVSVENKLRQVQNGARLDISSPKNYFTFEILEGGAVRLELTFETKGGISGEKEAGTFRSLFTFDLARHPSLIRSEGSWIRLAGNSGVSRRLRHPTFGALLIFEEDTNHGEDMAFRMIFELVPQVLYGFALSHSISEESRAFLMEALVSRGYQRAEDYDRLALALMSEGRYIEALDNFEVAVKKNPLEPSYFLHRGEVYRLTHFPRRALRDFDLATELNPKDARPYFYRAMLYGIATWWGRRELNTALELNPAYRDAYLQRGISRYLNNDFQAASRDLDQAIQLDASGTDTYYYRGLSRIRAGMLSEGIEDLNRVAQVDPDARIFFARGMALRGLGRTGEAIADFNRTLELDPEQVEAIYFRALSNFDLGNIDLAKIDFAMVLEKDPWHFRGRLRLNQLKLGL